MLKYLYNGTASVLSEIKHLLALRIIDNATGEVHVVVALGEVGKEVHIARKVGIALKLRFQDFVSGTRVGHSAVGILQGL